MARSGDSASTLQADTLIIGAGVIGTSIAFHLAERGEDVLIVDQGYPMSGTSGSTQAWVWIHTKTPLSYALFSQLSAQLYPDLVRRIGDVEYDRTGGISPILSEADLERAEKLVGAYSSAGLDVKLLTGNEARSLEPQLSSRVLGATFSPIDGNVNPLRLVAAYYRAAQRLGARFKLYTKVDAIETGKDRYRLRTDGPTLEAKNLVLAGGPWSEELGRMVGITIPVRPVRGQILV
ncbi:MAG TPA: FAD-dependent oxidoreductase, partial [Acidimicrobiales bacterium]|nr:FAD-dependent oxidoreductase [Acidimicrobiales bacterium]